MIVATTTMMMKFACIMNDLCLGDGVNVDGKNSVFRIGRVFVVST